MALSLKDFCNRFVESNTNVDVCVYSFLAYKLFVKYVTIAGSSFFTAELLKTLGRQDGSSQWERFCQSLFMPRKQQLKNFKTRLMSFATDAPEV